MKFFREKIFHREDNGPLPEGRGNATVPVIDQDARSDIILGDGTATFDVRDPNNPSLPATTITTVALTTNFADNRYEINIASHSRIYLNAKVLVLGGTVTGLESLIEFLDPDHINDDGSGFWIPSKEGVPRDSDESANIMGPLTAGNFSLASREEMFHFKKARISFRAATGAPDATTRIHVSWHHNGKVGVVAEQ